MAAGVGFVADEGEGCASRRAECGEAPPEEGGGIEHYSVVSMIVGGACLQRQ